MLALVDADSIYFRAVMSNLNKKDIRTIIDRTMYDIMGQCFCTETELMLAIKGRGNFRKKLYPQYKANRPDLSDKVKEGLNYAHEYMKDKWDAHEATGMEADDLVCIWAHEAIDMGEAYVIVGLDKDLLQIPGHHYNFKRMEHANINRNTAAYNLFIQCLTGDSSDNVPGIKGVGPKKASRALDHVAPPRYWNRVRAYWRAKGAGDPTLTRRLVEMIKTWDEFDEITKQLQVKTSECEQDVCEEGKGNV